MNKIKFNEWLKCWEQKNSTQRFVNTGYYKAKAAFHANDEYIDYLEKELELMDYYISFVIKNNLGEDFDKYVSDKLENIK